MWTIAAYLALVAGIAAVLVVLPWDEAAARSGALAFIAAVLASMGFGAGLIGVIRMKSRHLKKAAVILTSTSVLALAAGAYAQSHAAQVRGLLIAIFGPPAVVMEEAYAQDTDGAVFDHSAWDDLVARHVNAQGGLDYDGFNRDAAELNAYLTSLGNADFDSLSRDEKLAFLINAYNAFTVRLILDHDDGGKLASIMDIPKAQRWDAARWRVAGETLSLDQIEHERIRPRFKEPRIHWALVCAAYSCPPLRREAYVGAKLEEQLADQEAVVFAGPRWFIQEGPRRIKLTKLFEWFAGDFKQMSTDHTVTGYIAERVPGVNPSNPPSIQWIEYDWKLNDQKNLP